MNSVTTTNAATGTHVCPDPVLLPQSSNALIPNTIAPQLPRVFTPFSSEKFGYYFDINWEHSGGQLVSRPSLATAQTGNAEEPNTRIALDRLRTCWGSLNQ